MMISVNMMGSKESGFSLTGHYDGKTFGVSFDEAKYKKMLELADAANQVETVEKLKAIFAEFEPLTKESYKELVESKTPYLMVNKSNNKFYLKWNKKVSSIPVPQALVDRVIESVDKNIEILPLIKCWVRFMRNPNFTVAKARLFANYINKLYVNQKKVDELVKEGVSHEVAVERATTTQVTITQEGLLGTYKVSRESEHKFALDADGNSVKVKRYGATTIDEDTGLVTYAIPEFVEDRKFIPAIMGEGGDAFTCADLNRVGKKGHIIQVGKWHYLDTWDQVDCNDGRSGVKGLHCGGLDYVKGFQTQGTVTHNTFVDPVDLGAFTDDGTGAIRVKRYFTYSSFAGVNRSIYHSSKVAAYTDAEFDEMVAAAVLATQDAQSKISNDLEEKQALTM